MSKKNCSCKFCCLAAFFVSLILTFTLVTFALSREYVRAIHVFVALCDNKKQGIVPVPASLGNGEDPERNLYWGALYGVKTFFKKSASWKLVSVSNGLGDYVLERCLFEHKSGRVYLVADAYRGANIKQAISDFLYAASGRVRKKVSYRKDGRDIDLKINGLSDMVVYVGHDGLMDFKLETYPEKCSPVSMDAIILACRSRAFFKEAIDISGARPVLWTNGLMAPEAYVLERALEGWINNEGNESIRIRAAKAYNRYQRCGLSAAKRLFSYGN
ncbi:hypothetical protein ACFL2O_09105 [Thermodesulfobacteriota bacterium]